MNELFFVVMTIAMWSIPIVFLIYLFRTLATIVEGLRALNASSLRIAAAVEHMAAATSPGATPRG